MNTAAKLWHRQDIIAELKKEGSSLAGLGRTLGLSRATMAWALIKPHPRANAAIAEFLGVPMHELWPLWFLPNTPSPSQPSPQFSATRGKESRTSKKAA